MGRKPDYLARVAVVAVALAGSSACASREARDFGGRWMPANRYVATMETIPLDAVQVYQVSPMDGTLRNLLARWARDSGSELDYRHHPGPAVRSMRQLFSRWLYYAWARCFRSH